ncbi:MAG: hypothetical protein J1F35_04365 [Erysipelotrichales bacterium]|nr:hypothetical protein [Erysipelotrichales bacterium]
MINRILAELFEDYEKNKNFDAVIEFAEKTFPSDGTAQLFIGCVVILFTHLNGLFKPKYSCSRETLESIVLLAKEKVGTSNLLAFYIDRVNTEKNISKYLLKLVDDPNLDKYADVILDYLEGFKPDWVSDVKKHPSLNKYIESLEKKKDDGSC